MAVLVSIICVGLYMNLFRALSLIFLIARYSLMNVVILVKLKTETNTSGPSSSKSAWNELDSMSTYNFRTLFGSYLSGGTTHPKKRNGSCTEYGLFDSVDSCISLVLDISTA